MKKIYLVESDIIIDCENVRKHKAAYKEEDDARKDYENEVGVVKETFLDEIEDNDDWVAWEFGDEGKTCFESYEEGYFSITHGVVTLTELKVN